MRLLVFLQLYNSPVLQIPIADSKTYLVLAGDVLKGDVLASRTTFTNPFYFYFIAIIFSVTHLISQQSIVMIILVQILMSCISILILYQIAAKVFGVKEALLAVFFVSIYEILVFFDNVILSASLINFLNLCMIFYLLKYYEAKSLRYIFFSGLLFGLSIITRANLLLFIPFILIWLYLINRKSRSTILKSTGIFIAGVAIFIAPITIRNYVLTKEFIPISSNMGYNFYIGNNEKANGTYSKPEFIHSTYQYYEEKESHQEANKRSGRILSNNEASMFWFKEGLNFIYNNPSKYISILYRKIYLFFSNTETANNLSNYTGREYSSLLKYLPQNFGILSCLGIAGMVLSLLRSRDKKVMIIIFLVLAYFLSNLLIMTASEYRAPVILFMLIFGAYGLSILIQFINNKRYWQAILILIPVILFVFWTNYPDSTLKVYRSVDADLTAFGNELTLSKKYTEANAFYLKAIEIEPGNKYLYFQIADNYHQNNDIDNALKYYRLVPSIDKMDDSKKLGYLELSAFDLVKRKDFSGAISILEKLVNYEPDNYQLFNNLGTCYLNMGEYDTAEKYFLKSISLKSDYPQAIANLGFIEDKRNNFKKAIGDFEQAAVLDPSNPLYKLKLVELYLKTNQYDKSHEISVTIKNTYPPNSTVMNELDKVLKNYKKR